MKFSKSSPLLPTSLKRSITFALDNTIRKKWLTGATILIIGLILFIFNVVFTINLLVQESIENLKQKVDLMVYLKDDADLLLVNQLINELKTLPEIQKITYISKEEALKSLLEKYSNAMNYLGEEENPLPSSIQMVTKNPEDHETILAYLDQSNAQPLLLEIESNRENTQITDRLIEITGFTQKLLLGILLTFLLGSGLIIANTMQINIFQRRREIEIMKLVGAPLAFIRSPFMIEGALIGMCAVILSIVLLIAFNQSFDLNKIGFVEVNIRYGRLFFLELLTATAIGMMSSLMAIEPLLARKK